MQHHIETSLRIFVNITSSLSLVILIKFLKRDLSCKITISLSTFYLLVIWIFLEYIAFLGKIHRVSNIPFFKRFFLAFLITLSLISIILNLSFNSIGFYQISKLLVVPYIIIWNSLFNHRRYSLKEYFSISLLLVGVGLFTVSDVETNIFGTIAALISVLSAAHNQMYTEQLQKEYKCSCPELQLSVIPYGFCFGIICAAFTESNDPDSFTNFTFSANEICFILGSCLFAVGVYISTFGLIGKTNSIKNQVVEHSKAIIILIFGYIIFPSPWENKGQIFCATIGIIISLIGEFMYTKAKIDVIKSSTQESQQKAAEI